MEKKLISTNPGRGYEEIGSVTISSEEEIKAAVSKAHEAFPKWKALPLEERQKYVKKFLELYDARKEEIAELQSKEMGKPIAQSRNECKSRAVKTEMNVHRAEQILEPEIIDDSGDRVTEIHYEPYGVIAAIAPWNFPTSMFFGAFGQPLLAGNTVVFKHSEENPLTSKLLMDIVEEAGLPDGVFTTIYGTGEVGKTLAEQDVDLIFFTGSSKVGQELYKVAAEKFIPAILEMGGSSPGIIFEDVNVDEVCESAFEERFTNAGQVCCALKRLFAHESIVDEVVAKLKDIAEKQVIGDPLDEKTTIGPLAAERQQKILIDQVEDAKKKGATIVTGGSVPEGLEGAYFLPTVITDVTEVMKVVSEEVFGPVLPVISFKDEEEVVKMANDTEYGLSAFVYSKDEERGLRVASLLEAGQVSVNGCPYFSENAPFGGYKKSGIGHAKGDLGFYNLVQKKVLGRAK